MSLTSILKPSISATVAILALSLFSSAKAGSREALNVFPDLPASTAVGHASAEPTSHLPWLAPVGHRQPHQADVLPRAAVSAWESQQQEADREIDRKLMICRGC